MAGRVHKNKYAHKGMGQPASDRYHERGLERFDPDSKDMDMGRSADSSVPVSSGGMMNNGMGAADATSTNLMNSVMYGGVLLGNDIGLVLTGKIGPNQINMNNLLGAAVNIGVTGYAINYFMGRSTMDQNGFLISGVTQVVYGMISGYN